MRRNLLVRLLVLCGITVLGMIVHEAGHAVTAVIFGSEIRSVTMMPGIRLHPAIELRPWDGAIAEVAYSPPSEGWQAGLVLFMGCGLTTLVSYCAIVFLWVVRPQGVARFAWVSIAILLAWDGITYSVFPAFGLRHGIFVGGVDPEPVIGAAGMGIPSTVYYIGLALHVAVFHGLLLCYLVREKMRRMDGG